MPVLAAIRERFATEKPLAGLRVGACLHVTTETANLMRTLEAGGADVAALRLEPALDAGRRRGRARRRVRHPDLRHQGRGRTTPTTPTSTPRSTTGRRSRWTTAPTSSATLHARAPASLLGDIIGGTEETTTGVIRLRAMERDGVLGFPVIAVNEAETKHLFDNRYGTGQSTLDGIIRATNMLLAGKNVRRRRLRLVRPRRRDARPRHGRARRSSPRSTRCARSRPSMDGFRVMPMAEAATIGDIFVTVTGDKHVIRREHFEVMKDGAIIAQHRPLQRRDRHPGAARARRPTTRRCAPFVERVHDGRRPQDLPAGRGPARQPGRRRGPPGERDGHELRQPGARRPSTSVENARRPRAAGSTRCRRRSTARSRALKLETMGVAIDALTDEQRRYLASWDEGT